MTQMGGLKLADFVDCISVDGSPVGVHGPLVRTSFLFLQMILSARIVDHYGSG